ncbi:transporter [Rhizobium sp. ARZ01]|uniref:OmpP1/FadL family transporter n=1 Tax=Rhizobium sp. ARZ01 TaxID=2769313 RepID=UPI0017835D60|nr:OmpP1/FadL family transporter [Rhizobium sp. ARZ01]MBD9372144.1 transporter [Rhizobium sp. ARZ01]
MQRKTLASSVLGLAAFAVSTSALAGGLERHGYDVDLLFEKSPYVFDGTVTYVMPNREMKNAVDHSVHLNPATGLPLPTLNDLGYSSTADEYENYADPYLGAKASIGDAVDCVVDYSEPWGAHSNPGQGWAGAYDMTEIKVFSRNYGGACSYKFDAGPGKLRFIAGGFYQEVGGEKEALVLAPELLEMMGIVSSGLGRLEDMEGNGGGWRAGIGYEIPEYAMRASLVYTSKVDLGEINGVLDLTDLPVGLDPLSGINTPVYGTATMPEVLELKVQSGIAPDWLAFGSIKWTNWSRMQNISFCPKATKGIAGCFSGSPVEVTSLDLYYRDGWTVSSGVGHKFNDQWSGGVSLTWDRGTSTVTGSQSDSWTVGLGTAYTPTENVELRLGGALGILTSGESNPVHLTTTSYEYGTDFVSALSGELKIKF